LGAKRAGEAGFSLIELLVVVAMIVVLVAVALPNIGQYIRNYRVRGAVSQLASELQVARAKAISKNVNLGVVFAVVSSNQYQYAVEDDTNPRAAAPHPWGMVAQEGGGSWTALLADPGQGGPLRTLPLGVQFDNPANCGPAPTSTAWGLRFGRLGAACDFAGSCAPGPPNPPPYVQYVGFQNSGSALICLWEQTTNLRRTVTITSGGRIRTQP
jgi:prepilin-type N-terminal cleavage/methylation domain-containing protein